MMKQHALAKGRARNPNDGIAIGALICVKTPRPAIELLKPPKKSNENYQGGQDSK